MMKKCLDGPRYGCKVETLRTILSELNSNFQSNIQDVTAIHTAHALIHSVIFVRMAIGQFFFDGGQFVQLSESPAANSYVNSVQT